MPGSLVTDALEPTLLDTTIVSKTTTTGSAIEVDKADAVRLVLCVGTLAGSAATIDVEVQASDDNTFSVGVVSLGRFAQFTEAATGFPRYLQARITKRYARAVVITGGTTVTSVPICVRVREQHWEQGATDTA